MKAVKVLKQNYVLSPEIRQLLEDFRKMVNEAVRIGIERNISSKFKLIKEVYPAFKQYHLHTHYTLTACEKASSILKNYRREKRNNPNVRKPFVRRAFASVDNQSYSIENDKLKFAIRPRHFVEIPLTKHSVQVLCQQPSLRRGSVLITPSTINVAYSKEVEEKVPRGFIGIDRNLDNVTIASSDGSIDRFDTSKITMIKQRYSTTKSQFKRNDRRIRKQLYSKYGRKQSEIENQELHKISKKIVEKAKKLNFGIVMENLKGIRKLYRKGHFQGKKYRRRMNSWSFFKLQRMTEYKAKWKGVKILYVPPHKTSSTCAICGSKVVECVERKVWCPKCKTLVDRDKNAARSILARGLRFKPIGLSDEAVKRNQIRTTVLLQADGSQLTLQNHGDKSS